MPSDRCFLAALDSRDFLDYRTGRVHEIQGRDERIAAIAKEYAKSPENTLVISPDNRSRVEINERVHAELQRSGLVSNEEHHIRTLMPRQDLTGADRTWAERSPIPLNTETRE